MLNILDDFLNRFYFSLLAIFLGLLPFHPFLTTWLIDSLGSEWSLIKMWKEVVIVVLCGVIFVEKGILPCRSRTNPAPDFWRFDILDWLIVGFASLSVLTGVLLTGNGFPSNAEQIIWGFKYGVLFLVLFCFVRRINFTQKQVAALVHITLWSLSIVIVFGFLQIVFLPADFLVTFGYSAVYGNIEVAQNGLLSYCHKIELPVAADEFCRVQSFLSGPNQLAAYLVVGLSLLFVRLESNTSSSSSRSESCHRELEPYSECIRRKEKKANMRDLSKRFLTLQSLCFLAVRNDDFWSKIFWWSTLVLGIIVLLMTWGRAAILGGLVSFCVYFVVRFPSTKAALQIIGLSLFGVWIMVFPMLYGGAVWDAMQSYVVLMLVCLLGCVSSVIWQIYRRHVKACVCTNIVMLLSLVYPLLLGVLAVLRGFFGTFVWNIVVRPSSTQGHGERMADGIRFMIDQPWGLGLGDAGPASARFANAGETGFLPESWYLQVGLESGVLGFLLFIAIIVCVIRLLWQRRDDVLNFAVLLGCIAVSVACIFLHSWEAAPVAFTFWVLCGIVLRKQEVR